MIKIFAITFCLLLISGCQPATKYTTHKEYIEEREWDREKGLVKNSKVSWGIHWKD